MKHVERFVAGGEERLRTTPEFRAASRAIARDVRDEFAAELERAGALRRLLLSVRMRREIRSRVEQLAPKDAHYLSGK